MARFLFPSSTRLPWARPATGQSKESGAFCPGAYDSPDYSGDSVKGGLTALRGLRQWAAVWTTKRYRPAGAGTQRVQPHWESPSIPFHGTIVSALRAGSMMVGPVLSVQLARSARFSTDTRRQVSPFCDSTSTAARKNAPRSAGSSLTTRRPTSLLCGAVPGNGTRVTRVQARSGIAGRRCA
jgi:hypothetical protein